VGEVQDPDSLHVPAGADAPAAEDALAGVADDRVRQVVDGRLALLALEADLVDSQLVAQALQLAVLVALAGQALAVVVGQDQLDVGLDGLAHLGGVGPDVHALGHLQGAGGGQVAHRRPLDVGLDHAHAAGADLVDVLQEAQAGDLDPRLAGGQHGGVVVGNTDFNPVDRDVDVTHLGDRPSQFLAMALKEHTLKQAPQRMQRAWSMTCSCLTSPVMASTGQTRLHLVQPLQSAVIT